MSDLAPKDPEHQAWLANRPPIVRTVLTRWPPGCRFIVNDHPRIFWVMGARDDGQLIVSSVNPFLDYDGACDRATHRQFTLEQLAMATVVVRAPVAAAERVRRRQVGP